MFPQAGSSGVSVSKSLITIPVSATYEFSLFMHQYLMFTHHISSFHILARYMIMRLPSKEAVGIRYTGWAALGRDPQEDTLEYTCPYCGAHGVKAARRTPDQYHFTDGFLQDLQGEMAACHSCRHSLRIAPVVLLHDQDEKRRFEGVFSDDLVASKN
jgi:hypothetical protein